MSVQRYSLPWPPSANHYKSYRIATSREGKQFVQWYVMKPAQDFYNEVRSIVGYVTKPLEGPVRIDIVMFPPDRRKRDKDNLLKCLFDSLEKARVVNNDSQFDAGSWAFLDPVKGGRIDVTIEAMPERQAALAL